MTNKADPWSVPVTVAQIPETGLHRDIEADPATLEAMAEIAGLREILFAHASLDVTPKGGGRVQVAGRVRARVGQSCVVTLDPIENGVINLGRVATDALFLGIDPYPRRPDAVFETPAAIADPEDHPFAALKALQLDAKPTGAKKPKSR